MLDYAIAALTGVLIAVLSWRHALPAPRLLAIVAVSSLTNPLSNSGSRSLLPVLAPRHLWERANALDSGGHVMATLVGAPLAGLLVGYASAEWALTSSGALFAVGALAMAFVHDPSPRSAGGSIVREAWRGLQYVVRNATLRGLALTLSTFTLAWGALFIAIPLLLLGRPHHGPPALASLPRPMA